MQIHQLLENAFMKFPERKAVWDKGRWYTYKDLNNSVDSVAAYLLRIKIQRGDRVAVLLENSFYYIVVYFAILKVGAAVVSLNTETNPDELLYLLVDSDSKCLITQTKITKEVIPALRSCPLVKNLILTDSTQSLLPVIANVKVESIDLIMSQFETPVFIRSIDIDLAEIVYTSGSTGKSKGVMLSHLNLISNMRSTCNYLKLTEDDRVMVILPFYYIYGKSLLLTHIMTGASLVIDNGFVYPNTVLKTMEKTKVTGFAGVPSTFLILLNRSSLKTTKLVKLRYVTQAGGAMAPAVQKQVVEAFSPAQIFIMYGATEAAPRLSYLDPGFLFSKWGSIGIPVDNVDLKICDSEGNEVPHGEVGEITARGSNIMQGYWKDPEETNKVLRHGMYYTGDIGRVDEDGFFYIVGRINDMIKVKGYRVGAKEIEEAILDIDEVHETAVIGVEDPILGEAILALIIAKDKEWHDVEKIRYHLNRKLSLIKQPKFIEFRHSFPKNKSGKIMKATLKKNELKRWESQ